MLLAQGRLRVGGRIRQGAHMGASTSFLIRERGASLSLIWGNIRNIGGQTAQVRMQIRSTLATQTTLPFGVLPGSTVTISTSFTIPSTVPEGISYPVTVTIEDVTGPTPVVVAIDSRTVSIPTSPLPLAPSPAQLVADPLDLFIG